MSDQTYKVVLPILCSECMAITTFDIEAHKARGATYDCKCGRVMLIQDDLSTIDLYESMSERIKDKFSFDVDRSKFGYVELA